MKAINVLLLLREAALLYFLIIGSSTPLTNLHPVVLFFHSQSPAGRVSPGKDVFQVWTRTSNPEEYNSVFRRHLSLSSSTSLKKISSRSRTKSLGSSPTPPAQKTLSLAKNVEKLGKLAKVFVFGHNCGPLSPQYCPIVTSGVF